MIRYLLAAAVVTSFGSGCTYKTLSLPSMNPEPAKADYTVQGKTNDEVCADYVFAIDWGHLATNNQGSSASPHGASWGGHNNGPNREARRALYQALDKMPEATHLMASRVHTWGSGWVLPFTTLPIFGERCASVDAYGIRIGDKPLAPPPAPVENP